MTRLRFWLLTIAVFVSLLVWPVFAVLTSYGVQIPDGARRPLTFWLLWELVSIFVTIPVTFLFWISYFVRRGDSIPIFKWSEPSHISVGVICVITFLVGFVVAGIFAFMGWSLAWQVWLLVLGVVGTFSLQLLAMRATCSTLKERWKTISGTVSGKTKAAKEAHAILGNRDNVSKYLCFSDLPIGVAMVVLALAATVHPFNEHVYQEAELRAFVAGAVALQLLYSNFVFWVEALADTARGYRLLGGLPWWLRSIRVTLHPDEGKDWSDERVLNWVRSQLGRMFRENPASAAMAGGTGQEPMGGETDSQAKGG